MRFYFEVAVSIETFATFACAQLKIHLIQLLIITLAPASMSEQPIHDLKLKISRLPVIRSDSLFVSLACSGLIMVFVGFSFLTFCRRLLFHPIHQPRYNRR
jgi:hypothetical protein